MGNVSQQHNLDRTQAWGEPRKPRSQNPTKLLLDSLYSYLLLPTKNTGDRREKTEEERRGKLKLVKLTLFAGTNSAELLVAALCPMRGYAFHCIAHSISRRMLKSQAIV